MTSPAKIATSNANRYARYGLSLPQQTLRALENRGIYCQPRVSIEHQHLARRYVLRGIESGGAVADMGRYCAYLDADGSPALRQRSGLCATRVQPGTGDYAGGSTLLIQAQNRPETRAIHVLTVSEIIGGNGCKAFFDEWNSLVVQDKSGKDVKKSRFGK